MDRPPLGLIVIGLVLIVAIIVTVVLVNRAKRRRVAQHQYPPGYGAQPVQYQQPPPYPPGYGAQPVQYQQPPPGWSAGPPGQR